MVGADASVTSVAVLSEQEYVGLICFFLFLIVSVRCIAQIYGDGQIRGTTGIDVYGLTPWEKAVATDVGRNLDLIDPDLSVPAHVIGVPYLINSPLTLRHPPLGMLVSSALSLSSVSFNNNNDDHPKFSPTHVYYRQQHTVQIIELVECTAPPPRNIASVIHDSDYSSSYSSSDDNDDSDQEDEAATSYCSSDVPPEHSESPPIPSGEGESLPIELASDSYSSTKRILAWRENFASDFGTAFAGTSLTPPWTSHPDLSLPDSSSLPMSLKRKLDIDTDSVSDPIYPALALLLTVFG